MRLRVCVTAELAALLPFHLLDGGAALHNLDATLGCLLLRGGNTSPRMGPAAGSRVYGPEEGPDWFPQPLPIRMKPGNRNDEEMRRAGTC